MDGGTNHRRQNEDGEHRSENPRAGGQAGEIVGRLANGEMTDATDIIGLREDGGVVQQNERKEVGREV